MSEALNSHLISLQVASGECLKQTIESDLSILGPIHQLDLDISGWVASVAGPEKHQLASARRELAHAEYSLASGFYRQAYSSLRLFLELSFAAVHFSANEFERRRWMSDRLDFSWSKALDSETGILSAGFIQEFSDCARASAPRFAVQAEQCYRRCSQFIHGKAAQVGHLPNTISYQKLTVVDWCATARSSAEAVLFLLFARYGIEVDYNAKPALHDSIVLNFGHISEIRKELGLA